MRVAQRITGIVAVCAAASAALASAGCGGESLVLPADGAPAALAVVSGDGQRGTAGAKLPAAITVAVTDGKERPVADQAVEFRVVDGGGEVAPASATTDANGHATTSWVLGSGTGVQRLEIRLGGSGTVDLRDTVSATAGARAAARLARVRGDGQQGTVGAALPDSLVVQAFDSAGVPVPGIAVAWSASGGGGVSAATTVSGADGRTGVVRTLGTTPGSVTTVATAAGLERAPVTFAATAVPGAAGRLTIVTQPSSSAESGTAFARQPTVQLADADGNVVHKSGVAVTVAVASGGGTLGGTTTRSTGSDGRAAFTDLAITGSAGTRTLLFAAPGVSGVTSDPISVTERASPPPPPPPPPSPGPPSASRSSVDASPSSVAPGASSTVTVTVRDANDAPLAGSTVRVSVSPVTATLSPTSKSTGSSGTATFTFSSLVPGSYTVSATADGVAITDQASVSVGSSQGDTPPTAVDDDNYTTTINTTLDVAAPGVLANDVDPDGDPLTAVYVSGPAHGTVHLHADGSFSYTPEPGFQGADLFSYRANDGTADSKNTAGVTVTVQSPGHARHGGPGP